MDMGAMGHAMDIAAGSPTAVPTAGPKVSSFLSTLHAIVEDPASDEIIRWTSAPGARLRARAQPSRSGRPSVMTTAADPATGASQRRSRPRQR